MDALVIGAAGGFGGCVGRELERRGHRVRALVRPGGRTPDLRAADLVEGDALDPVAVAHAARGTDAIVWGFHLPYSKWVPGAIEAARVTADVAATEGATVLFPGNVYGLSPSLAPLDETAPHEARTRLGEIRNEIESIFEHATVRGAQVVVLRAGEYFGPDAHNTWLELLTARALRGGRILDPGGHGIPHAWAYLPDVARASVDLLEHRETLAPFDVFHFSGYSIDSSSMIDEVRRVLGDTSRRTWPFPWGLLRAASPFSKLLRLASDMRYLWNEQVVLDGTKLQATLPAFRTTPFREALTTTLMDLAAKAGAPLSRSLANAA
jgi:nucleoside-diphosphate-sugar epimerase